MAAAIHYIGNTVDVRVGQRRNATAVYTIYMASRVFDVYSQGHDTYRKIQKQFTEKLDNVYLPLGQPGEHPAHALRRSLEMQNEAKHAKEPDSMGMRYDITRRKERSVPLPTWGY